MRAIQQHYREQGREPTDVELETLAQTCQSTVRTKHLKPPFTIESWIATAACLKSRPLTACSSSTSCGQRSKSHVPGSYQLSAITLASYALHNRRILPLKSRRIIIPPLSNHSEEQIQVWAV